MGKTPQSVAAATDATETSSADAIQFVSSVHQRYRSAHIREARKYLTTLPTFTRIYFYLGSVVAPLGSLVLVFYFAVMGVRSGYVPMRAHLPLAMLISVAPLLIWSSYGSHWVLMRPLRTDHRLHFSQAGIWLGLVGYILLSLSLLFLSGPQYLVIAPFSALLLFGVSFVLMGVGRLLRQRASVLQMMGIVTGLSLILALATVSNGPIILAILGISMVMIVVGCVPVVSVAINLILLNYLAGERKDKALDQTRPIIYFFLVGVGIFLTLLVGLLQSGFVDPLGN